MTDEEVIGYTKKGKEKLILDKINQCFSLRKSKSLDVRYLLDCFNMTVDFNELKHFVQTDTKKRYTLSRDFCSIKINN